MTFILSSQLAEVHLGRSASLSLLLFRRMLLCSSSHIVLPIRDMNRRTVVINICKLMSLLLEEYYCSSSLNFVMIILQMYINPCNATVYMYAYYGI